MDKNCKISICLECILYNKIFSIDIGAILVKCSYLSIIKKTFTTDH